MSGTAAPRDLNRPGVYDQREAACKTRLPFTPTPEKLKRHGIGEVTRRKPELGHALRAQGAKSAQPSQPVSLDQALH